MRKIMRLGVGPHRLMYYEQPSLFSGKRGAALIAVILLHVVIVWGFYTGLAGQLVQKIIPPVEIAQIEKPKDVDKPPPPPPKLEEIKPYVPPPEFVDIQAAPPENNAISVVTQQKAAAACAGRGSPGAAHHHAAEVDPKHPFKIGEEYYPDASRRAGEEGSCILMMKCRATGQIQDATDSNQHRLTRAWTRRV